MLCEGRHLTKDDKCNMVGCKSNAGQNCTHNVYKCVNCIGNHIVKANCCVKKQETIKMAREERCTWRVREGEHLNVTTDQRKKPVRTEDAELLTSDAERNVQDGEQIGQNPEVQVEATHETDRSTSKAGTKEPPGTQW